MNGASKITSLTSANRIYIGENLYASLEHGLKPDFEALIDIP
jgi:hypothetical protein